MRRLWIILLSVMLSAAFPLQAFTQEAGDAWTEPVTGMEFVWVPGGCFEMGCGAWTRDCFDAELPVREVCVDGFWLGKYEVTQGQWRALTNNANPSRFADGDDHPVERVTWDGAQSFIQRLESQGEGGHDFRLPTEAEWEYACRSGGLEEMYAGGDDVAAFAWHDGNSGGRTHPVGSLSPNGLGLYDMSGNVWEWVQDTFNPEAYASSARDNPVYDEGVGSVRVRRGGSWDSYPRYARCGSRDRNAPTYSHAVLGFRVARTN